MHAPTAAPPRARSARRRQRVVRKSPSGLTAALLATLWLALVAPSPAGAAPLTLYTNTAGPVSVDDPPIPISDTTLFANQFFTFGTQSVIGSLELSLLNVADLAGIQVRLYDNTFDVPNQTDQPGDPIATFRSDSHSGDLYRFVLTSQPWLDANAPYWIVTTATRASASAVWTWTTLNPSGDDPLNPGRTLDQSLLWATRDGGAWSVASGGPFQMEIVVTSVPEPSTWAMGAAGLAFASIGALRRRARHTPPWRAAA